MTKFTKNLIEYLLFYSPLTFKNYLFKAFGKIGSAAMRFPAVTLSAVAAFVFVLVYFHFYQYFEVSRRQWIFLTYEGIVGISMYLSFALFSEKYQVDIGKRIGLWLTGICILGLHYYALPNWAINIDATYFLRFFTFWVIFTLLITFVVFYKEKNKIAFWQFNQYIFIQFVVSFAFSMALFLGIASSLFAIEKLYDLQISEAYYFDMLAFFGLVVNTIFFSASLPNDFNWFKEPQSFRRPLRLFIQYVLLPILLIYYIILIVYLGKIALSGLLPNGWVALPILIFSSIGVVTYYLAYPLSYEKENTSIRFYVSKFFYFLLPLLTLLFAATITRVLDYGLTEYRYLGLLLGIWLAVVAIYTIVKKETSLVLFPVSLFLLLFLASVGPWGMYQLSARSQFLRLNSMLQQENLIENKLLSVKKLQLNLTDSLAAEIGSINKYLFYRERIDLVYPILAEAEKKKIDSIKMSDNKIYAFNAFLKSTFSLPEKEHLPDYRRFHFYANDLDSLSIDVSPYKKMQFLNFDNLEVDTNFYMRGDTLCYVHKDKLCYPIFPYLDSLTAFHFASADWDDFIYDDYVNVPSRMNYLKFTDTRKKTQILFTDFGYRRNADSSISLENASFYFFE